MKIRTALALTRARERGLSRRHDPHTLRFHACLLRQVVAALDTVEGRRLSHVPCAVIALTLAGLGVTGRVDDAPSRRSSDRAPERGVLDFVHQRRPVSEGCADWRSLLTPQARPSPARHPGGPL